MQDDLFTQLVTKAIRDINTEPTLTAEEKAAAIKKLGGIPREVMFDYLNIRYRTGPDIADYVKNWVSPGRPRGGPSTTKPGTTLKTLTDKIKSLNPSKRKQTL